MQKSDTPLLPLVKYAHSLRFHYRAAAVESAPVNKCARFSETTVQDECACVYTLCIDVDHVIERTENAMTERENETS